MNYFNKIIVLTIFCHISIYFYPIYHLWKENFKNQNISKFGNLIFNIIINDNSINSGSIGKSLVLTLCLVSRNYSPVLNKVASRLTVYISSDNSLTIVGNIGSNFVNISSINSGFFEIPNKIIKTIWDHIFFDKLGTAFLKFKVAAHK